MRLKEINKTRNSYAGSVQPLPEGDHSAAVSKKFVLKKGQSTRQYLARAVSGPLLAMVSRHNRALLQSDPGITVDHWAVEERFVNHAGWAKLMGHLPRLSEMDVLVPGCYMADEDVQFWLRKGVKSLAGIDIYSLETHWQDIIPQLKRAYGVPVTFKQGSIEDIPFGEKKFDVIVSEAVLEHVRNLDAMVDETYRVLKPGGYALHNFGPLYFCFGADHCISAFGEAHGYDHLLLPETDYRAKISQRNLFEQAAGNPDLAFWAENDQFSFATAKTYLETFSKKFEIINSVAKISSRGLSYRAAHPNIWKKLLDAGVVETDLLIKGLSLLVRRPINR